MTLVGTVVAMVAVVAGALIQGTIGFGFAFVAVPTLTLLRPDALPAADLVVLASASAAESFAPLGRAVPVVSIGPVTSAAASGAGLDVVAEAATHDLDGLEAAVRVAASRIASSPS